QVHALGLRPIEVGLVSALRSNSVKELMELINKERKGRDVYIVGTTNVGKSTLINQIINIATESENVITTSYFPGTTLGTIQIPLEDGSHLIDTPGIIQRNNLTHYLEGKELKQVIPRKEIKPKVYQLEEEQTVLIDGLAGFDYHDGAGIQPFVFYTSNDLDLHRTKLENADDLYQRQLGELLNPPFKKSVKNFPELKEHQFMIEEAKDIVISGLGWISVHQSPAKISVWAPEGVEIYLRKPMI
ncbi:MAG: ribosome biogenesis GTPase YqeH, partial [Atopostipes suicloacalis]|nr:ribosome biogenesis GTPase YqeH [Atopostipes suicloacalis]